MQPLLIYNLFPRLVGTIDSWTPHAERIKEMGFNWLMLNPVNCPGFSGSIYAIKDFYKLDPLLVPPSASEPMDELERAIEQMHRQGLKVMFDLVINHTSKDSPLVKNHPTWFRRNQRGFVVSPYAVDPTDASKITVWRDLAEVDNASSVDRKDVWKYWTSLVQFYLDLGFDGFRCDAAYKVPAELWSHLIASARKKRPEALFVAETLGCRPEEISALSEAGFSALFNSSKWWNFDQGWCLEQHEEFGRIAPSISFPESHDTKRLFLETKNLLQVQKQRYAFAAAFSLGVLIPVGYECCFRRRLHVVRTRPEHWETGGPDLSAFITRVNRLKLAHPALAAEGHWDVVTDLNSPTTILCKRDASTTPVAVIIVNKDWHGHQWVDVAPVRARIAGNIEMMRVCRDTPPDPEPLPDRINLDPAEVIYVFARGSLRT